MAVQKHQLTAIEKAKKQFDADAKALKKAKDQKDKSLAKANKYKKLAKKHPKSKKKYERLRSKQLRDYKAKNSKYNRINSKYKASKAKYDKLVRYDNNKKSVDNKIANQRQGWHNEGTAAIYRSDNHSSNVIFISPGDAESEDTQTNVTSYPVDVGSPRSNYARTSSKTIQVGGIIAGETRAEADKKYGLLMRWSNEHVELTYQGSFTERSLIISDIQKSYSTLQDNLKVSITFAFVQAAEIKVSSGKHSKTKKSKSSKTTAGSRNKNYSAITIKWGDTLLGLSRKYGKSVSWLQKVNHIKNPNLIYAGNRLYVGTRKKKVRVK